MNLLKTFCVGVLLTVSNETHSQINNKTTKYFTADSLSFIYLLPNKNFGFISYQGESPFSYYNDKNQIMGSIDGPYFIVNEKGFGKYSLQGNKLDLNFISPKHSIDSISKKYYTQPKLNDSLSVEIIIKPYYSNLVESETIGIGTKIASKNGMINLNTMFENNVNFKIGKNQLPMELFVNGKYSFIIKKKVNHVIELYFNCFKKMTTDNIKNKVIDYSKLTKMTTD